jgi:hypothetical protein
MTKAWPGIENVGSDLGFTQIYKTDTFSACKKAMIRRCNNF